MWPLKTLHTVDLYADTITTVTARLFLKNFTRNLRRYLSMMELYTESAKHSGFVYSKNQVLHPPPYLPINCSGGATRFLWFYVTKSSSELPPVRDVASRAAAFSPPQPRLLLQDGDVDVAALGGVAGQDQHLRGRPRGAQVWPQTPLGPAATQIHQGLSRLWKKRKSARRVRGKRFALCVFGAISGLLWLLLLLPLPELRGLTLFSRSSVRRAFLSQEISFLEILTHASVQNLLGVLDTASGVPTTCHHSSGTSRTARSCSTSLRSLWESLWCPTAPSAMCLMLVSFTSRIVVLVMFRLGMFLASWYPLVGLVLWPPPFASHGKSCVPPCLWPRCDRSALPPRWPGKEGR